LSQRVLVEKHGLLDALDHLVAPLSPRRRLLLKHLVMGRSCLVGHIGPRSMMERLRWRLMGLIDELALRILRSRVVV